MPRCSRGSVPLAADGGIVMAGRDIGTVVLPDAGLKLFLDASVEERARRRAEERGVDPEGPEGQQILVDLRRRDELDRNRPVAPLRPASDARIISTDGNTFEETVAALTNAIRDARRHGDERRAPDRLVDHAAHLDDDVRRPDLRPRHGRIKVEGAIDDIPKDGPLIIAANHASNFDAIVLGSWLIPRLGRRIHWLGKKELFDWPIVGWAAANGGVHPVDRGTADVEAFRLAKRILDEGQILFVFPEGTRSPDGALQEARDGVAVLALRTGAPILPVGIGGSNGVWPRGQKLPHPGGHVTVRVGRPFRLADELPPGIDRKAAKALATDLIMRRIAEQLPPGQRGVYGGSEPDPVR